MEKDRIKVLLVEDDSIDVEVVRRQLSQFAAIKTEITHMETLAGALAQLKSGAFDVILLDLRLPDSSEDETFDEMRKAANDVPIVVLTSLNSSNQGLSWVRRGAQDFLVKGEFAADLLGRVVAYAVERSSLTRQLEDSRERERRERELRELEKLATLDVGRVTDSYAAPSASTEVKLNQLSYAYLELLEREVEARILSGRQERISTDIRSFAQKLGILGFGPRDLIKIHGLAIRTGAKGATNERTKILMEEGRLLLLETMGSVVLYYKDLKMGSAKSS